MATAVTLSAGVQLNRNDSARVRRVLGKLSPAQNANINRKSLRKCGLLVQKIAAEEMIVRGRGRHAPPLPDRLTTRTGTLARSIALVIDGATATVGTDLIYGAVHEFSPSHPRPFLSPALEKAESKFEGIFIKVLEEELRKA